jgi:hypothetical protein
MRHVPCAAIPRPPYSLTSSIASSNSFPSASYRSPNVRAVNAHVVDLNCAARRSVSTISISSNISPRNRRFAFAPDAFFVCDGPASTIAGMRIFGISTSTCDDAPIVLDNMRKVVQKYHLRSTTRFAPRVSRFATAIVVFFFVAPSLTFFTVVSCGSFPSHDIPSQKHPFLSFRQRAHRRSFVPYTQVPRSPKEVHRSHCETHPRHQQNAVKTNRIACVPFPRCPAVLQPSQYVSASLRVVPPRWLSRRRCPSLRP